MTSLSSEEQELFLSTTAGFFESRAPRSSLAQATETAAGYDARTWRQMADELGVQALAVPECYGGQGLGVGALSLALEAAGSVLLPGPLFSSAALATITICNLGDDSNKADLLPRMATGDSIVTVAFSERTATGITDDVTATARPGSREGDVILDGTKAIVPYGAEADFVLVPAIQSERGLVVAVVPTSGAGVEIQALQPFDLTRRFAEITLREGHGRVLGQHRDAGAALERSYDQARICLAAEMLGSARTCFELALEYAQNRQQFGRPIGSFQSIKHMLANMYVAVQELQVAVDYARRAMSAKGDPSWEELGCLTKGTASTTADFVALEALHIFGGIGFTAEHHSHLFVRRAKSSSLLLGDADAMGERYLSFLERTRMRGGSVASGAPGAED